MDLNYGANVPTQSLKAMCAVKVASAILERYHNLQDTYASVEKLDLPTSLKAFIKDFIAPMRLHLIDWRDKLHFKVPPIWTSYGSVDLRRSTKAFLKDETVESRVRYLVACKFCHKKYVFRLGKHLNKYLLCIHRILYHAPSHSDLLKAHITPLGELWLDIIHAYGGLHCPDRSRLQQLYLKGFDYALRSSNDIAVKYFIGKLSTEAVMGIWHENPNFLHRWSRNFSPETHCSLFFKLNVAEKELSKNFFSKTLLQSLLEFPYQRFFKKAALSLTGDLSTSTYHSVLKAVCEKAVHCKDYDYDDCVSCIWELGAAQRLRQRFSWYEEDIMQLSVRFRDKYISSLCYDFPDWNLEVLYLFATMCCWESDLDKRILFHCLEDIIRRNKFNTKNSLQEFKTNVLARADRSRDKWWVGRKCKAQVRRFSYVLDKIIARAPGP